MSKASDPDSDRDHSLPNCSYRVPLVEDGFFYCRHSMVRTRHQIVTPGMCDCCTVREVPCDCPHPPASKLLARGQLQAHLLSNRAYRRASEPPQSIREQLHELLTIAIFDCGRNNRLAGLLASIREQYREIPVLVAVSDKDHKRSCDRDLEVVSVEPNGLSSAVPLELTRNCSTPYLLTVESDCVFGTETRLERLVEILQGDPTIGVVGGSLVVDDDRVEVAADIGFFCGQLNTVAPSRPCLLTNHGTRFQIVGQVSTFALHRRSMLMEQTWDGTLALAEQSTYYGAIQQRSRWRVAVCRDVSCRKISAPSPFSDVNPGNVLSEASLPLPPLRRDVNGEPKRSEKPDWTHGFTSTGLSGETGQGTLSKDDSCGAGIEEEKRFPSGRSSSTIVLFGVAHSGTTIVTNMLMGMGWHGGQRPEDVDPRYAEHIAIRKLNIRATHDGFFDEARGSEELSRLPAPWIVKDPRFVDTLGRWLPVFAKYRPTLIWLVRDIEAVKQSYRRRQGFLQVEPTSYGQPIEERYAKALAAFEAWPWPKLRINFEDVMSAVAMFDVGRARDGPGNVPGR